MFQISARALICVVAALAFQPAAFAASGFARIIEAQPIPWMGSRACFKAMSNPLEFQIVESIHNFSGVRTEEPTQSRRITTERAPEIDPIVERVLKDWVDQRDFTADQAKLLAARDNQLDPRRTSYVHLETDGRPGIVRVFDGSSEVLSGGKKWIEASEASSTTPIEIGAEGFVLPERKNPNRPAYLVELGLLDVDRQLKAGVETALSHVAERLDRDYNDGEYFIFGRTKLIEQRAMMIYAQTRPNRVAPFQKYGFEPVMTTDAGGASVPFEVSRNLVLLKMTAGDFLKVHLTGKAFAGLKRDPAEPFDPAKVAEFRRVVAERVEHIEKRILPIRSFDDVQKVGRSIFELYLTARLLKGRSLERARAAQAFIDGYLMMVNSIPAHLRNPDWVQARNLAREMHVLNTPFKALYAFSKAMDRAAVGEEADLAYRRISEEQFVQGAQPVSRIKLFIPSQPMPVFYADVPK